LKRRFLYIILFFSFFNVSAQKVSKEVAIDTTRIVEKKFEETNIKDYRNDNDFVYDVVDEGPSVFEQIYDWIDRVLRKMLSWVFDDVEAPVGFLLSLLMMLPYIIAVIVLYLIINFFLKVNARNIISGKRNKEIVHLKDDEELLSSKDLPRLIALAISEENYRLAIRYQYLLVLQQLSEKEIIIWEQQKTNEDYSKEVHHKNIHTEFEEITRFYDFVWYGNFEISKESYLKGIENITEIKRKIT